jgi:hypothetical protein
MGCIKLTWHVILSRNVAISNSCKKQQQSVSSEISYGLHQTYLACHLVPKCGDQKNLQKTTTISFK